jgi:acyl-CoA synthetase (AMP-forming)/AMP-acid ligase II
VEFLDGLPKTATGKVQKFALRERYRASDSNRGQGE